MSEECRHAGIGSATCPGCDFEVQAIITAMQEQIAALQAEIAALKAERDRARDLILQYKGFDGAHHKDWLLDQVVRILAGDDYDDLIIHYMDGENGASTYEWDTGIAP